KGHLKETDLWRCMSLYDSSKRACQQLTAKANAKEWNILFCNLANQNFFLSEIGVFVALVHMLYATKCNNGSICSWIRKHFLCDMYDIMGDVIFFQNVAKIPFVICPAMLENEYLAHALAYPFAFSSLYISFVLLRSNISPPRT